VSELSLHANSAFSREYKGQSQWQIKGGSDWATARVPQFLSRKKVQYVNNKQYAVKDTIANWN